MDEDLLNAVLRCGLYIGAIFQIICIAAVIILPESTNNVYFPGRDSDISEDEMSDPNSPLESPKRPQPHHKMKKTEKKKRR